MGIFVSESTFFAFGMVPVGEMVCPRKSASVAPIVAFEGEILRLCFRRRRKKSFVNA